MENLPARLALRRRFAKGSFMKQSSEVPRSPGFGVASMFSATFFLTLPTVCLLFASPFTFAQSAPVLVSVTPPNGDTNAAPRGSVIFEFDQTMEATPLQATIPMVLVGNYQFAPANVSTLFNSSFWSADRKTLTFMPSGAIPLNTAVTWTLNPAGTPIPLRSAAGVELATVSGGYQIASNSGGSPNETCPPANPAPGTYTFTKYVQYLQTSALDPVPSPGNPAIVVTQVQSPSDGPAVTGGFLAFPAGTNKNLVSVAGFFRISDFFAMEATMNATYPVGDYMLHFNQSGETERVILLSLPETPTVIPKIENFAEAQSIDATRDFTLRWNSYSPQSANPIVRVVITDEFANRIFLAPNACVPRTLDPMATSIVIPANYLRPGFNYQGQLIFSEKFYSSTSAVPKMNGNGFVQRSTLFTLKAATGSNSVPSEQCDPGVTTVGSYTVIKNLEYQQTSAQEVIPRTGSAEFFGVTVVAPPAGPAVTNGSLTLPDNSTRALSNQLGYFVLNELFASEPELDATYGAGTYALRFSQTNQPERIIPMTIPETPPSIPQIQNYDEAQAINGTNSFTLTWNSFTPQCPGAFIRLIITDSLGHLVFLAPNPCVPRDLSPMATSIVIPANYFGAGVDYLGSLQFGCNFYNSTSDVPQMAGYGAVQRVTTFSLKAASSGSGTATPARFTHFQLLPNGHPFFQLSGTAGKNYMIQRAGSLRNPVWTPLDSVMMDASGAAAFEDTDAALVFPAFYRVMTGNN